MASRLFAGAAGAETRSASVLDASALMAVLHAEDGAAVVIEAIGEGAAVSVVNWAGIESFDFEPVEVLHSPLATHIRYRRAE